MRVLLLKDVPQLGKKNEIKTVSNGFGRNYLLPKGLAKVATEETEKNVEVMKAHEREHAEKELIESQKKAEELEGLTVLIKAPANEKGELYAKISTSEVHKKLADLEFSVLESQIKIEKPIKKVGEHKIPIVFSDGIEAEIKLLVEPAE